MACEMPSIRVICKAKRVADSPFVRHYLDDRAHYWAGEPGMYDEKVNILSPF